MFYLSFNDIMNLVHINKYNNCHIYNTIETYLFGQSLYTDTSLVFLFIKWVYTKYEKFNQKIRETSMIVSPYKSNKFI